MKLHINRKKRKTIERVISIAIVLCMTFSMGSSYVVAGADDIAAESRMPGENSAGVSAGPESGNINEDANPEQPNTELTTGTTEEGPDSDAAPSEPTQAPDGTPAPENGQSPEGTPNPETSQNPEGTPNPETSQNPEGTPNPETSQSPEGTPAPETSQSPEGTPAPEITQSPEGTDSPVTEQTPVPEATGSPVPAQTPQPTQTPAVPEEDFSDLMSFDELSGLATETVGATKFRANRILGGNQNSVANDGSWSFDAYYVNEADRYNVTKTDDFSLKYQMEFHASRDFGAGEVKVRIHGALLEYRYGWSIATPNDIGVPATGWDDEGNPAANPSRSTSFNYYYADADENQKSPYYSPETPWLVFCNYKDIASGTNAAWQVLYSNLKLMQIADETSWSRTPEISVDGGESYVEGSALSGRVNSSVALTSVVKTPYYEAGRKYTPGLYTLSQLRNYADKIDGEFILMEDGKEKLNPAYRYVVWDVKIRGNATQPWELFVMDTPGVDGSSAAAKVVGYKDNSDQTTVYDYPVKSRQMEYLAASGEQKSWGHRFWVVTAYPADEVEANTTVKNDITVTLHPVDGIDEDVVLAATPSAWSYKNYDWSYSGDVIGVTKKNSWSAVNDTREYTGWLEAYRRAKGNGEDYGDIPFTVTGRMNGYETTHYVEGARLGEYKENTSYILKTVDDFIYVHYDGKETLLGADDYYFSSVTISQKDYGYDIYEDKMIDSERQSLVNAGKLDPEFGAVNVYAMFAKSAEGTENTGETWELAGRVSMDEKGNAVYTFTAEQIAREPYRVMAEHASVDYRTVCEIKAAVRIKANSPVLTEIVNAREEQAEDEISPVLRFENLSGVLGLQQADGQQSTVCDTADASSGNLNYENRPELQEKTQALYNHLLVRDNAFRDVSWLNMTAQANKKYTSKNDANNNRVLVDYYLTAYDGYEIYDRSCLDYLTKHDQDMMSPGRKHVVFYDLLPYGMQFDASTPVTAGRIKELDIKGDYMTRTKSWDSTQVSVTVDPDRDIIPDYKGTGRTMVAFHISYSGADSTSYTAGKWIEGWGVSFRAYYDWKNMDSINKVDANANLCAFMPDFSVEDNINETNPTLYGLRDSVYADDGEMTDPAKAAVYKDLLLGNGKPENKGNIDGISTYDSCRNVLYAEEKLNDNVAVSSESSITKLVRADEDRFGTFRESATVSYDGTEENRGTYTYEITVSAENDIQGIAAFDRLENAAVDRKNSGSEEKDPFAPFSEKTWHGSFLSVDLSGLEKQGTTGTVYYSDDRNAAITENQAPEEILTQDRGWYTEEAFREKMKSEHPEASEAEWTDYVQAVAVKVDPDFTLEQGHSISFRIQMQAPAEEEATKDAYAYNNVFFSSYIEGSADTRATVSSNSVRVGVSRPERLEIVKRTAGVVPTALQNERFAFRLYEKYTEGGEPQYLAFQAYDLYKADKNAGWVKQEGQLHATDENGYLYLKADEKAVFKAADTDRIVVEEKSSVFWESSPAPGEPVREVTYREETDANGNTRRVRDDNGDIHVRTWTNTYRPVLYVQKELSAVPNGAALSESDRTFTFKLQVKKNGVYEPLANAEFWYVDSVLLDGGVPTRVNKDGEVWTEENGRGDIKKTAADGTFTIREGQIIALFPGTAGTEYMLTEENLDENGYGLNQNQNWYCTVPEVTGTIPAEGSSETITNYYRWKDLYLTKKITHQDPVECTQAFTFQITELELDENGRLKLDENGNPIEVIKRDAEGNPAVDENGNPITATAGKEWRLLSTEDDGTGNSAAGTLDSEGKFTCAFGGQTVIISGLEAGKYYMVKEMAIAPDENGNILYRPVKDTEEFKMPPYSVKKEVTITNDYLKRPLSVTKTVSGEKNEADPNPEFLFTIKVDNQLLPAGISYTVTEQGNVVDGGTGVTDGSREFRLRDGQTVTFKDAGMLGQNFEVTETPYNGYDQLYPANGQPATGTLSGEGGKASFVNGSANALRISKEYVAAEGDTTAEIVANRWRNIFHNWENGEHVTTSEISDDRAVELLLEVTDAQGTYIWPRQDDVWVDVLVPGNSGDEAITVKLLWEKGKSIKLLPGLTLSIPFGNSYDRIPQNATYTLTEAESSRKRIVKWFELYLQINQKYPADNGSITGTAAGTPNAVIVNEISTLTFNGSKIGKQMTSASSEVPAGEKLVWRLEKYDNGTWIPAEGIRYAVFDDAGTPISNEVKATEADGKILLTKTEGHYPEVWFTENTVYINLYNEITETLLGILGHATGTPLLRLVEVPEESGKEWGMLVGYGTKGSDSYSWEPELSNPQNQVRTFFNSNRKSSIEIEKYMETRSYQEFTMILEQVVAVKGNAGEITKDNYQDKILKSEPRGGIPYTIHNVDGSEVTGNRNGTTGPGGEIRLKAGQYVILDVPDGTVWTVSEDVYATQNYELKNLAPETEQSGGKLTKLDDNLMLINLPAAMRYMLIYDGNGGNVTNLPATMTIETDSASEDAAFIVSGVIPVRAGYTFLGWADEAADTGAGYEAGDKIQTSAMKSSQKTLYAVWEKGWSYKLVYDANGGTIEGWTSKVDTAKVTDLSTTTGIRLFENQKREGYRFLEWSESLNAEVAEYPYPKEPQHSYSIKFTPEQPEKTLYAVWEKVDVTISKQASKEYPKVEEEFKYTITVSNDGTSPVFVTVTDRLDEKLEFVRFSQNDGGVYDSETRIATWENVTVPAKGSRQLNVWVTANSTGEIQNTAKFKVGDITGSGNCDVTVKSE
nr:InlB B-repeat-containing protein [uncultured Acetatifactor sp.]